MSASTTIPQFALEDVSFPSEISLKVPQDHMIDQNRSSRWFVEGRAALQLNSTSLCQDCAATVPGGSTAHASCGRCRHRWTDTHSNAAFDSDVSEIRPSENLENVSEQADSGVMRRMSDTVSFHHALVSGWLASAAA
jgi:hypothetical protein